MLDKCYPCNLVQIFLVSWNCFSVLYCFLVCVFRNYLKAITFVKHKGRNFFFEQNLTRVTLQFRGKKKKEIHLEQVLWSGLMLICNIFDR